MAENPYESPKHDGTKGQSDLRIASRVTGLVLVASLIAVAAVYIVAGALIYMFGFDWLN